MHNVAFVAVVAQFQESIFHVLAPFATKNCFLINRDIVTINGTLDEMVGGAATVASSNGTFYNTDANFSE
jgi:hypothetical protein